MDAKRFGNEHLNDHFFLFKKKKSKLKIFK